MESSGIPQATLGAREHILLQPFSRSSAATTPFTLVPRSSRCKIKKVSSDCDPNWTVVTDLAIEKDRRIVIETNPSTVGPPRLFLRPHYDSMPYISFADYVEKLGSAFA